MVGVRIRAELEIWLAGWPTTSPFSPKCHRTLQRYSLYWNWDCRAIRGAGIRAISRTVIGTVSGVVSGTESLAVSGGVIGLGIELDSTVSGAVSDWNWKLNCNRTSNKI